MSSISATPIVNSIYEPLSSSILNSSISVLSPEVLTILKIVGLVSLIGLICVGIGYLIYYAIYPRHDESLPKILSISNEEAPPQTVPENFLSKPTQEVLSKKKTSFSVKESWKKTLPKYQTLSKKTNQSFNSDQKEEELTIDELIETIENPTLTLAEQLKECSKKFAFPTKMFLHLPNKHVGCIIFNHKKFSLDLSGKTTNKRMIVIGNDNTDISTIKNQIAQRFLKDLITIKNPHPDIPFEKQFEKELKNIFLNFHFMDSSKPACIIDNPNNVLLKIGEKEIVDKTMIIIAENDNDLNILSSQLKNDWMKDWNYDVKTFTLKDINPNFKSVRDVKIEEGKSI